MITCEHITPLLFDYLDGLLTNHDKKELEEHLANCPTCREELVRCRQTIALIQQAGHLPPKDFSTSVLAEINREKAARRKKFMHIGSTAAACIVLAMVLAVLPYVRNLTRENCAADCAPAATGAAGLTKELAQATNEDILYSLSDALLDQTYPEEEMGVNDSLILDSDPIVNGKADMSMTEAEPEIADPSPAGSSNNLFYIYVGAYCPELIGQVSLLCIGNDAAAHLEDFAPDEPYSQGANYTLYRIDYTDRLADSLQDLADEYLLNLYQASDKEAYIIYVEIR